MKRLLTLVGTKIIRFFWSWGFLKFCLWTITLIILVYAEEDWRGARAWAATKAEWEAKGETFDFNKFIPPPVPDDENLAAIPLFELKKKPSPYGQQPYLAMPNLEKALHDEISAIVNLSMGNWHEGVLVDKEKVREALARDYANLFDYETPPPDKLAQFDTIFPFTADLRAAAATHPFFRVNMDYSVIPPFARPFGPITKAIMVTQVLTFHAVLALDHEQPDIALADIKTNFIVLSGVKRDPSLVGGLVALSASSISLGGVYHGLANHEWRDAQLAELEQTLEPINFLADYQFSMRSEVAASTSTLNFLQHAHRSEIKKIFEGEETEPTLLMLLDIPGPDGWWDLNKSQIASFFFQSLADVDPQSRMVFPKANLELQDQIEKANASWDAYAPWKGLAISTASSVSSGMEKFAQGQVWVDEARIACALERYRLARGVYPASLDALTPSYIGKLPHDIMNGQPYHYQLRPDGTFLLYSVGWNQTDDGGKVVYMKDIPTKIDYTQGDWVWPTPKYNH